MAQSIDLNNPIWFVFYVTVEVPTQLFASGELFLNSSKLQVPANAAILYLVLPLAQPNFPKFELSHVAVLAVLVYALVMRYGS